MSYASQAGRARTSPSNPQAHAICDRCGFRYNHANLRWQYDWRGASLANIRLLVCNTCYDNAQQQLRAIVVPADPLPISNPRTQDFVAAEAGPVPFVAMAQSADPSDAFLSVPPDEETP
jgi:hypothetical protein